MNKLKKSTKSTHSLSIDTIQSNNEPIIKQNHSISLIGGTIITSGNTSTQPEINNSNNDIIRTTGETNNELFESDLEKTSDSAADKDVKKNKPGRPRKNPIRQPQKRIGLVSNPADERNYVEFLYDNPERFKKIFSYFKSHAVNKVFITFKESSIFFWCEDNAQKNKMRVKIDCNLVNHYYCPNTLSVGISCDHLENIMATIDKTYNSILILSQRDSLQNYIQIILKDDSHTDESYKIELIEEYNNFHNIDHIFDEQDEYMLYFTLPSKKFKSMINNMAAFTDQVSIELHSANDPLLFQYLSRDNKIKHTTTIRNNMFVLKQQLDENDTFRTSFVIDYVKAISSSLISDSITVYADEDRPLLFTNVIDGGCIEVRTLTNIIDKRYEHEQQYY
jgi:hypothetical protein